MRPELPDPLARCIAVREVMKPDVIVVRDDMTIQEAAAFLVENQISGAPVEDAEGRLIGVVSYADIARVASELPRMDAPPAYVEGLGRFFTRDWEDQPEALPDPPQYDSGLTVREIMTPELFSVAAEEPVGTAARMMLDAHIHRVLVTDGHKVVGILTTSDLLSLLTERR
jgi:CBS domain-containing protein